MVSVLHKTHKNLFLSAAGQQQWKCLMAFSNEAKILIEHVSCKNKGFCSNSFGHAHRVLKGYCQDTSEPELRRPQNT